MSMTVSVRIEGKKARATSGQVKHDIREGNQPEYVDQEKTKLNSVLVEPMPESELKNLCEQRRIEAGAKRKMRSDASVSQIGIITFGTEAQKVIEKLTPEQQDFYFKKAASDAASHCKNEITGLVVHRDESAIHAHFQMPAICRDGKPQSKKGIDFGELQDKVAVGFESLGINRGVKKEVRKDRGEPESAYIHRSVKQLHEDLPKEIKAAEKRLERAMEVNPEIDIKPVLAEVVTKRTWWGTKTKNYSVYDASKVDKVMKEAAAKTSRASATETELTRSLEHAERLKGLNSRLNKELKSTSSKFKEVLKVIAHGDDEMVAEMRESAKKALKPTQKQQDNDRGMSR